LFSGKEDKGFTSLFFFVDSEMVTKKISSGKWFCRKQYFPNWKCRIYFEEISFKGATCANVFILKGMLHRSVIFLQLNVLLFQRGAHRTVLNAGMGHALPQRNTATMLGIVRTTAMKLNVVMCLDQLFTRCQAKCLTSSKFLTCYCLSVILLLRIKL